MVIGEVNGVERDPGGLAGCAPDCWAAAHRCLAGSCLVELARAFQKKKKAGTVDAPAGEPGLTDQGCLGCWLFDGRGAHHNEKSHVPSSRDR